MKKLYFFLYCPLARSGCGPKLLAAPSFAAPSFAARLLVAGLAGLLGGIIGCGQEPPNEPTTLAPYHPLADGAWWDYQHDDWTERVTVTSTRVDGESVDGESAFVMTDSPNPKDNVRSDATLVERNGRVLRISKEEYLIGADGAATLKDSVSYGAGFTRFDESWAEQAVGFKETPEYERVEMDAGGAPKPAQQRRHSFEVLSLSEQVVTPLGSFDCIQIRRTKDWQAEAEGIDASDAQPKIFWFARGVGKVRELNLDTGKGELLVDYSVPDMGSIAGVSQLLSAAEPAVPAAQPPTGSAAQ